MKFLLVGINSKYIHSNPAVYLLKAYAGNQEDILIKEYSINQEKSDIIASVYEQQPDVIAFSCYIWNISYVIDIAEDIYRIKKIPIWFGGPEAAYNCERLMQEHEWLTGIMLGEGEETFKELFERYQESPSPDASDIKGLYCRTEDGQCIYTAKREEIDYDKVPFIYDDLSPFNNRIIYYETSRGCPFHCSYCLSSADNTVRFRSLEKVFRELDIFLEAKVPQVKFVDRTFNCKRERARKIWQYIKEHDNGITNFHFEIGADLMQDEDFLILKDMRKGLVQFEIGVQTTNQSTAEAVCRSAPFDKISYAVKKIAQGNNIHQHLDLIAGLPFEDYRTFEKSFNDVYELMPDQLQLGFLKVLAGTCMYKNAPSYGIVWSGRAPYEVLKTKWLGYGDIIRLKGIEACVEWFYNSGQYPGTMKYLSGIEKQGMFHLFEAMAEEYSIKPGKNIMLGRKQQFEWFYEFIVKYCPKEQDILAQLLIMDYYLRDPSSARPEFAKAVSADKEAVKHFYIEEALKRRVLSAYSGCDSRQLQHLTHIERLAWRFTDGCFEKADTYYLFDYRNRDFRYGNAAVTDITQYVNNPSLAASRLEERGLYG